MKFLIRVNKHKFKRKPTSLEVAKIARGFRIYECVLIELKKIICKGMSIKPAIVDSYGRFESQQIFFVDVDNTENFHSANYNIKRCEIYGLTPALVYPTFSYTVQNQKHRLVFIMDKPVTDLTTRNRIQKYLNNLFLGDSKTVDVNRIFFGTNKAPFFLSNNKVNTEDILKKVEAVQYEFI